MLRKHFNIYIKKKNFLGASNRKTSPIFGIYTEKIMWRSNWFEQKRRKKKKKKRKEKKKVNDWQSCSLTISDSVVCREKKRIDKLPLDSFYFVNHRICFPSYQIGKKKFSIQISGYWAGLHQIDPGTCFLSEGVI